MGGRVHMAHLRTAIDNDRACCWWAFYADGADMTGEPTAIVLLRPEDVTEYARAHDYPVIYRVEMGSLVLGMGVAIGRPRTTVEG